MAGLIRYVPSSSVAVGRPDPVAPAGVGATTDGAEWTAEVLGWEHMPGRDAGLPRPALVEGVNQHSGARKTPDGGLV